MNCSYACNSAEHWIARRSFLGSLAAGGVGLAGGFELLARPATAQQIVLGGKRVLLFWLEGGLSQLESWDPKTDTTIGGPFRSIPTSVPGLHICELLPQTAKQMHRLAVIRSVNTSESEHARAIQLMTTGHRPVPGALHPRLGATMSKVLERPGNPLPGHIHARNAGGGRGNDAAYLGPKYASFAVAVDKPLQHVQRPEQVTAESDQKRHALRRRINDQFAQWRRTAETDAYAVSYEQALQVMERGDVFDLGKEPERDRQRYGNSDLGKHCLLARRLLEHDIPFVQVTHRNYDSHHENFNFHLEQVGEFDGAFATTIEDLAERGLLESTLVIVMSEFGRSPAINAGLGREHWCNAWSVVLGGAGIQPGAVIGKTNDQCTEVVDRPVDQRHLFHTFLEAVNVDPTDTFDVAGKEIPIADPAGESIEELLI